MEKPLYTLSEAAKVLGITRQALWYHIDKGKIDVANVKGDLYLIDHDTLEGLKEDYNRS